MTFANLGLPNAVLTNLEQLGYSQPTPIQQEAIPLALKGKNLIAAAQTGSGKTATFVLPMLTTLMQGQTQRKKRARAIILAPTRELVLQVNDRIGEYGKGLGCHEGMTFIIPSNTQTDRRSNPNIIRYQKG